MLICSRLFSSSLISRSCNALHPIAIGLGYTVENRITTPMRASCIPEIFTSVRHIYGYENGRIYPSFVVINKKKDANSNQPLASHFFIFLYAVSFLCGQHGKKDVSLYSLYFFIFPKNYGKIKNRDSPMVVHRLSSFINNLEEGRVSQGMRFFSLRVTELLTY